MKVKYEVSGMTCAACAARVEKAARQVQGVISADVNLLSGKLVVELEDLSVSAVVAASVSEAGYPTRVEQSGCDNANEVKSGKSDTKMRLFISAAFLVVLMYFTMGHMLGLPMPAWYHGVENAMTASLLQLLLTIPVIVLNKSYYIRGIKALCNRAPNMDSLVAVGSGAAVLYSIIALFAISNAMGHGNWQTVAVYRENLYFESAAMILTLVSLGKYLEARAKAKTGDALQKLVELSPQTAFVRRNGELLELPIEQVVQGDIVCVKAGGSIPVDGKVVSGRAAVDQSALTGESVPIECDVGDKVCAATINTDGYLEICAEHVGQDTVLAKIITMVEDAGGSKAPIARLADKISGIFVPVVMTIACIAFAVWMFVGATFEFALTTAISVLVISCPCALGLATPVAIMVGTGRAANLGILFKNAEVLENMHRVDTIVLDKTGTLTIGKPVVTDIVPNAVSETELLRLALSLESSSEHPFAKAIVSHAKELPCAQVADFTTLPGLGVCGTVDSVKYYAGNKSLMEQIGVCVPPFADFAETGKTPLYFASAEGTYLGAIFAADMLKEDSAEVVSRLKFMKREVIMLTGDNQLTAQAIAQSANIDQVIANVLPGEKSNVIKRLQSDGRRVLMVGDGINDAPALTVADVGMAIGTGMDIAVESADVVLMQDSLTGICNALEISKATIRNIKQNLFWAFFYNCIGIPIAAGVLYSLLHLQLSPMLGAAAMSFSSVFVVTNALRLRFFKPTNFKQHENSEDAIAAEAESLMDIIITVEGMMCTHCKARVESVCKAVPCVTNAVVDLQKKQVVVSGNGSVDEIKKAITDAGYEVIG